MQERETCNVELSFRAANFYVVFENKSSLQCCYSMACHIIEPSPWNLFLLDNVYQGYELVVFR